MMNNGRKENDFMWRFCAIKMSERLYCSLIKNILRNRVTARIKMIVYQHGIQQVQRLLLIVAVEAVQDGVPPWCIGVVFVQSH